jgi:hypothetical protein
MKEGRIWIEDPWTAAMHLRGMLESDLTHRALIGATINERPIRLRQHAAEAVDAFMRAYGARAGHTPD